MTNQPTNNEWIENLIDKIWYLKRYSDTRYFDWEEIKNELKKLIIDNLPQSISREAISKKETTDELIEKIIDDMSERPFPRTWEIEAMNMRKILKKHLSYKLNKFTEL